MKGMFEEQEEKKGLIHNIDGRMYVNFGLLSIEMTKKKAFGKCVCCGRQIQIHSGSNVIVTVCSIDEKKTMECIYNEKGCKGVETCPNKGLFDEKMVNDITTYLNDLIEDMIIDFEDVLILRTPESIKASLKYYANTAFFVDLLEEGKRFFVHMHVYHDKLFAQMMESVHDLKEDGERDDFKQAIQKTIK